MNDELTPESTRPEDTGPLSAGASPEPSGPDTEPPSPRAGPATAGGMIRDARQAQGIALASLAAMLKIPLRRLEALEQDRHDELQGPTFERALAQAACRVLKIDPKPVLALLPQHERNTLERVSEGINTPFRDGQGGAALEIPAALRPVFALVALLVLAAVALMAVPQHWIDHVRASLAVTPAASAVADAAPVPAASAAARVAAGASAPGADVPASATSAASPEQNQDAAAVPAADQAAAPAVAAATAGPSGAGVDEVLAHEAAAPGIPVQVIASADSWVEVVDAQGRTLLSRTVMAGESVGLDGALPMRVKIGNAGGTHLKLRGDNVDLTPWTRDNVARLQLK